MATIDETGIEEVAERAIDTAGLRPVSKGTAAAYAGLCADFEGWCHPQRPSADEAPPRWLTAWPCTPETLALYMSALAEQGVAPGTMRKAKAAILRRIRLNGGPVPDDLPATRVLTAHERTWKEQGLGRKRAEPLRLDDFVAVLRTVDRGRVQGRRDAAILFCAYAGLMASPRIAGLRLGEVVYDGQVLRVGSTVMRHWVLDGVHHPVLCPVEAIDSGWARVLAERGVAPGEPLMRPVDLVDRIGGVDAVRTGSMSPGGGLGKNGPWDILDRILTAAGYAGRGVTLRSLREGGIVAQRLAGMPVHEIAGAAGLAADSRSLLAYVTAAEEWAPVSTLTLA